MTGKLPPVATMTNSQLGRRIGVGHAMASRLRNGKRLPSVRVMRTIAAEFGVPVERLTEAHCLGPDAFGRVLREAIGDGAVGEQRVAA